MYVIAPRGTGGWRTDCATSEREPADGRCISLAIDKKPDLDLGLFRSFDLHKAVEDELVAGDGRLVAWCLEAKLGLAEERDEDRLRLAHLEVLGRPPTPEELQEARNFLAE